MNFRQKITLGLLLHVVLCSVAFAQVVDIPDPNLRAAILEELQLPPGATITKEDMLRMTHLGAQRRHVIDLTGLEHAINLERAGLYANKITDIRPLAGLLRLEHLHLRNNLIVDVSPLANLTRLTILRIQHNRIVDITPLAKLRQLNHLDLGGNLIVDVSPLATLHQLEYLDVSRNPAYDYSALDSLSLTTFLFDQICEYPAFSIDNRIHNRGHPSLFAAWGGRNIFDRPDLSGEQDSATHDLWWGFPQFVGMRYKRTPEGQHIIGNVDQALAHRQQYLDYNPHMIFLVGVEMFTFPRHWFPEDWPHWLSHDPDTYRRTPDFTHPVVQDFIVDRALAVERCGLYDGIFIDHWNEEIHYLKGRGPTLEDELEARVTILQRIRAQARPDFLILVNTKRHKIPRSAPYVNGSFFETTFPSTRDPEQIERYLLATENSLLWADENLRAPQINALQGWGSAATPGDSPYNLRWMRIFTTLGLTHSNAYVIFNDGQNPGLHYMYDFWDADLGQPVGEKGQLYQETEGLYIREFTNGWAVYNHSGETQEITLPELVTGVESGVEGTTHTLPNLDGEMYLRAKPKNPADVNGDGVVNIFDLTLVAQAISTGEGAGDVNGDGVVNVFDLVQVAGAIGGGGAAPPADSLDLSIISAADVERWLALAQNLDIGDANLQRGIRFLEGLLAALTPEETTLLPNYPNPFNPETWIPYRLARGAEVHITIYDAKGTPVRQLALGYQAAGYYADRGRAAYWDGRNDDGEAVASGVYVYQFQAGDYAAARRMVIVK